MPIRNEVRASRLVAVDRRVESLPGPGYNIAESDARWPQRQVFLQSHRMGRIVSASRHRLLPLAASATVGCLLACHWLLATTAIAGKSATFDEPAHLGAGVSYWCLNDYRLEVLNGLPQRLAALPLLPLIDAAPAFEANWLDTGGHYSYGASVLGAEPRRAAWLLHVARMAVALAGVGLAGLVFFWSKRMHGWWGGLVSLIACCFEPSMLANGPLVATDVPAACGLFAATCAAWANLERVTIGRVVVSCLASAAILLTKWTGVLIIPIMGLLMLARLVRGTPLPLGRQYVVRSRTAQALCCAGLMLLHTLAMWAAMWASVGFRFGPTPAGGQDDAVVRHVWNEECFAKEHRLRHVVDWLRTKRIVPETFLASFAGTSQVTAARRAFFFGEVRTTGFTWFFPYCLWAKTNPALFVLLAIGAAVAFRQRDQSDQAWVAVPVFVLLGVYGTTAFGSRLNIGQRHLLPMFPALFVLAGRAGLTLTAQGRGVLDTALRWTTLAAIAAFPITAVSVWPNYLAYFNGLSGGSRTAYHRVVDSSLDWGQELVSLRRWLQRSSLPSADTPVYLSAFSSLPPEHYGLHVRLLPCFFNPVLRDIPPALEPGVYCISATMLAGVYSPMAGPLSESQEAKLLAIDTIARELRNAGKGSDQWRAIISRRLPGEWQQMFETYSQLRFVKLRDLLRSRVPDEMLGAAMLIYRLSADDLAALY